MQHTVTLPITKVQVGMTIVNGPRNTFVQDIKHAACSSRGTHVNKGACYDSIAEVEVQANVKGDPTFRSGAPSKKPASKKPSPATI